jgi:hypothetical protein
MNVYRLWVMAFIHDTNVTHSLTEKWRYDLLTHQHSVMLKVFLNLRPWTSYIQQLEHTLPSQKPNQLTHMYIFIGEEAW